MLEIATKGEAVIVKVRVQPKASRDAIVGEYSGALKVSVTAPPDKGKANKAVVEVLARALGIAKSNVELTGGAASRGKTFAIRGATKAQVEALATGGA
ncbi:MAG: YggU family protein [Verrucomicrobia bacterium]|nr:YggU family protein [Verrucomicrobiota bacterium]